MVSDMINRRGNLATITGQRQPHAPSRKKRMSLRIDLKQGAVDMVLTRVVLQHLVQGSYSLPLVARSH